jgi:glycosyltransferase involved in cell wall biosynthesis
VLAEANASGIPVIAYDRGSCREVIADGETGYVVDSVDEAVAAVAKIPEIDRSACRRRVERLFSRAAMVEGYERVYDTVFAKRDDETSGESDLSDDKRVGF